LSVSWDYVHLLWTCLALCTYKGKRPFLTRHSLSSSIFLCQQGKRAKSWWTNSINLEYPLFTTTADWMLKFNGQKMIDSFFITYGSIKPISPSIYIGQYCKENTIWIHTPIGNKIWIAFLSFVLLCCVDKMILKAKNEDKNLHWRTHLCMQIIYVLHNITINIISMVFTHFKKYQNSFFLYVSLQIFDPLELN
jgi:hypothetical protein